MTYRAYLLDIEGTTTPVDFVYKTLFPFARRALPDYLQRAAQGPAAAALRDDATFLAEEYAADLAAGRSPPAWDDRPSPSSVLPYLLWLMDHDRKSRGLKSLQGRIWEQGYRSGALQGEIYPDVQPALHRWRDRGARIFIYSSGSVLAQKLLFGHLPAPAGDLTPLFAGHFDTEVGAKRESSSYATIASRIGVPAAEILFLSDTPEELHAARAAGMSALQIVRNPVAGSHGASVHSFDEVA
jgi:enolase-phosphatase E1